MKISLVETGKDLEKNWPYTPGRKTLPYAQGMKLEGPGTLLILAGQPAYGDKGEIVGVGDMEKQARQAYQNIADLLKVAGAKPTDIVKETVYTTDVDAYLRKASKTRLAFYGDYVPVNTLIGVSRLAQEELMIEIEVMAVLE
ncbi:MAG: RidA family protein [Desulfobacterales bacterium]|nr:RidA family protein [Desulfobacterales bacterium]